MWVFGYGSLMWDGPPCHQQPLDPLDGHQRSLLHLTFSETKHDPALHTQSAIDLPVSPHVALYLLRAHFRGRSKSRSE